MDKKSPVRLARFAVAITGAVNPRSNREDWRARAVAEARRKLQKTAVATNLMLKWE